MEYTTFETQAHDGIVTFPEAMKAYGNAKVLVTIIPQESPQEVGIQPFVPVTMGEYQKRLQEAEFSVWTEEEINEWEADLQHMRQWTLPSW